jgi:hypothetical protein
MLNYEYDVVYEILEPQFRKRHINLRTNRSYTRAHSLYDLIFFSEKYVFSMKNNLLGQARGILPCLKSSTAY